jgi:tRNA threonylcarbamoyladenosine modification (KEOPS) complex Cgi121 subunit
MDVPEFPIRRVKFAQQISQPREFVGNWLEKRPSEYFVLLAPTAIVSDEQLWVAKNKVFLNQTRSLMRSQTIDGEFIRLIAGTQNMNLAFDRVGIKEGDSEAWIAYIGDEQSPDFDTIFDDLKLEESDIRPAFELGDSQRSGIEEAKDSFAYLGQIHIADLS